jgi:hypothetical protein
MSEVDTRVTTSQRYLDLVDAFLLGPSVTQEGKGFGSSALKVHGRIFAMLSSSGQFVIKLPKTRVDELVAAGEGERFDPGHGRVMKEWLALHDDSRQDWNVLASEGLEFVSSRKK